MNKITTTNWILIVTISIIVLIVGINIFGKNTTKRVDLENGGYKIEYYNRSGTLVKTENYDKDGKLTTNSFTGKHY